MESELKKLKFKELYDLIYGGQLLRFVRKEALRTDTHPSVILMLVIREYRKKVKDMAARN